MTKLKMKNYNTILTEKRQKYPLSVKHLEKQIKTIEEQGEKQVEALEVLKPIIYKLTINLIKLKK